VDVSDVMKLKGAMVQPCGLANQFTLTETRERALKARLTQDLFFSITGEDVVVNKRVKMNEYPEMIYGWCLSRVIRYIVALRLREI